MKKTHIKALYDSLNQYEKEILQQSKTDFERTENIRFTNLESYINYLARAVIVKQHSGEFVPRNLKEAQTGYTLRA